MKADIKKGQSLGDIAQRFRRPTRLLVTRRVELEQSGAERMVQTQMRHVRVEMIICVAAVFAHEYLKRSVWGRCGFDLALKEEGYLATALLVAVTVILSVHLSQMRFE